MSQKIFLNRKRQKSPTAWLQEETPRGLQLRHQTFHIPVLTAATRQETLSRCPVQILRSWFKPHQSATKKTASTRSSKTEKIHYCGHVCPEEILTEKVHRHTVCQNHINGGTVPPGTERKVPSTGQQTKLNHIWFSERAIRAVNSSLLKITGTYLQRGHRDKRTNDWFIGAI